MSHEQFSRRQFLQTSAKGVGFAAWGSSALSFTPSLSDSYSDSEQVAAILEPLRIVHKNRSTHSIQFGGTQRVG